MNFCYCTLALGDRYHELARLFLRSLIERSQHDCVVVTDHDGVLIDHPRIKQVQHNAAIKGHNISLKWLAYKHSLQMEYDTVCFVDIDSILTEHYDDTSVKQLIKDGIGCNWSITYKKDFVPKRRGGKKLQQLVTEQDMYPIVCPVECFMMLSGDVNRSIAFINEWSKLQQQIHDQKMFHREVCHEIGLAAKRVDLPVYKYRGGRKTYTEMFKHYGTHRGKGEMIAENS